MTALPVKPLILLTGATGYVGGLKALRTAGYRVRCVARRSEFLASRVSPETQIVKGDCLDAASLPPACAGVVLRRPADRTLHRSVGALTGEWKEKLYYTRADPQDDAE